MILYSMKRSDIPPGTGKTGTINGQPVSVYNDNGTFIVLNNTCTHAACETEWNADEQTWDCPCHGSRFHPSGEVMNGPATDPLPRLSVIAEHDELQLSPGD